MKYLKNIFDMKKLAYKHILFVAFCFLSHTTIAVEQELKKESTLFNQTFSWQVMGGISVFSAQSPLKGVEQEGAEDYLALSILIDLYYKGFFIQSNHRRTTSLTQGSETGYQLHVDNNWELDILLKSYLSGYEPDLLIEDKGKDIPSISGLATREFGGAVALRYSYFSEDSIWSIDLARLAPWTEAEGWLLDLYYSDLYIYRNWDIYIGAGLTLYQDKVTNYYYGITEQEVTAARHAYQASNGYKGSLEVYARYPISKKWSFNAGITHTYYSDSIFNSPIIDKQHITQFLLGAVYVF